MNGRAKQQAATASPSKDPELSQYQAYINKGLGHMSAERYERAIKYFQAAQELKPQLANTYYLKSTAYQHLGNFAEAYANIRRCTELAPNVPHVIEQAQAILKSVSKISILMFITSFRSIAIQKMLLQECLNKNTFLGERFWEKEGLLPCSLERGTLKFIVDCLAELYQDVHVNKPQATATYSLFKPEKQGLTENVTFIKGPGNSQL